MTSDEKPPPWHASGVKGVVPPGRKLAPKSVKVVDATPWRASGVRGIQLGEGEKLNASQERWRLDRGPRGKNRRQASPTLRAKPVPAPKLEEQPLSLMGFLEQVATFFRDHPPASECSEVLSELIGQSHAPYEIILGFTILSSVIGQNTQLRNKYAWSLERGARAFYNLAMRLDENVTPPRGLVPQRLDPLFYDLPTTAFQIPYAFATDAYLRIMELLRKDTPYDRELVRFGRKLYQEHIQGHRYGDQDIRELFSSELPDWAPHIEDCP